MLVTAIQSVVVVNSVQLEGEDETCEINESDDDEDGDENGMELRLRGWYP